MTKTSGPGGLAIADIDADGRLDILVAADDAILWYGTGKGDVRDKWVQKVLVEKLPGVGRTEITSMRRDKRWEIAAARGFKGRDELACAYQLVPNETASALPWRAIEVGRLRGWPARLGWLRKENGNLLLLAVGVREYAQRNDKQTSGWLDAYHQDAPKNIWKKESLFDHFPETFDLETVHHFAGDLARFGTQDGYIWVFMHERPYASRILDALDEGHVNTSAGQIAGGDTPGGSFIATIEPPWGEQLVIYSQCLKPGKEDLFHRRIAANTLSQGSSLVCADLLGDGVSWVIVGSRDKTAEGPRKGGIRGWHPVDGKLDKWEEVLIDKSLFPCDELIAADLDGNGTAELIARDADSGEVYIYSTRGN